MKSYLSLIPISAKVHKRQNRMVLFCIIISVFLVTSIFSIADAALQSQKTGTTLRHGDWHIQISGPSDVDAKQIATMPGISAASWWETINYEMTKTGLGTMGDLCKIDGKKTALCGIQESFISEIMKYFSQNATIRNENDIILSAGARELLGVKEGDTVTLQMPKGSYEFTITGFRSNDSKWISSNGGEDSALLVKADEIGAFLSIDALRSICEQENLTPTASEFYLQFQNPRQYKKILSDIKKKCAVTDDMIRQNKMLMATMGLSDGTYFAYAYGAAGVLFLLILMAGVFMISGSLNSNITQRSQFFGMLRCIGASKKQIIRFVRAEALNWCKTAIPAGILLGAACSCGLCSFVKYFIGGEFSYFPTFSFSLIGILSGIAVGMITVLLAAQSPAKKAARVSPAAAVSGNAMSQKNIRRAVNLRFFKIETSLGVHHATAAKKNLLLMTCSFALSIVMFLSFSVLLELAGYLMPQKSSSPNVSVMGENYSNSIDDSLVETLKSMPHVKEAFGRTSISGLPATFSKKTTQTTLNLISYDEVQLCWLEKDHDLRKGSDVSKVIGDQGYILTIYDKSNPLGIGDTVRLNDTELTIAGVLKNSPFSNDGTTGGELDMICSKETIERLTGEKHYGIVDIHLTKDATDDDVNAINQIAMSRGWELRDRREEADQRFLTGIRLLVYSFLLIVAIISISNIVNSISMSVSARIKQYGAMRAVGMDGKQITKTIAAEAYAYAFFGILFGCGLGLPISKTMYRYLITSHFGESFQWSFPALQLLVILALMFAAVVISIQAPSKRIRQMAITDTINEL